MSLRESRFQVTTESGSTYHLTAAELRTRYHEIEPHDPKERQAGTRYTLIWTGKRTLKHQSPQFSIRGASCTPEADQLTLSTMFRFGSHWEQQACA